MWYNIRAPQTEGGRPEGSGEAKSREDDLWKLNNEEIVQRESTKKEAKDSRISRATKSRQFLREQ